MRWSFLLLLTGCIVEHSSDCADGQYLTLNSDCQPITALTGDTASIDIPDEDSDADTDTDTDSDTDSDTDTDTDVDQDLIEIMDVSCDTDKWYYSVSTIEPAGSVELHVVQTGGEDEEERHTLQLTGTTDGGGGIYERDLFQVSGYYFEDTATQFDCIEGSNPDLTWRVDLYTDASYTSSIGCVTWGHDPGFYQSAGCGSWSTD
jgi:hypothetical protein